jgi:periplasmic divalent cation tolerance protein
MLFVYTTTQDKEKTQALVDEVIDRKLVARANFWPINSTYFWEGEKRSVERYMVMFTTHSAMAHDLEASIIASHSGTVPLIARTEVDMVNNAYQKWVNETLGM